MIEIFSASPNDPLNHLRRLTKQCLKILLRRNECEHCGSIWGVKLEPSYTAYYWDGVGEDPNREVMLCRACAEYHRDYWQERWDEYYAGLL
jgi:hypothetical protein